ncbi:LysE family translocator [Paenibacillus protaetiae]|uniref:LysE family translocator n=1 Tax=Paenibacillus protaetiae TaxID=2509456 RepID=A0A4P6EYY9_9BACL|nr:LysE family translocator [Paenibacillus protaetiae]
MDFHQMLGFLAVAVVLTLIPGPDIVFVAAQSMTKSRKSGLAVTLGLCTGLLVHTTLAALGISAIVLSSDKAFMAIKVLGALYLLYLAWKTWSGRKKSSSPAGTAGQELGGTTPEPEQETGASQREIGFAALYRRGITMNVINPKVSLFFLALLPQFVAEDKGNVPFQMIQLGVLFIIQALIIFSCVSLLSSLAGGFATGRSSKWAPRLAIAEAVIYVLLATNLFLL